MRCFGNQDRFAIPFILLLVVAHVLLSSSPTTQAMLISPISSRNVSTGMFRRNIPIRFCFRHGVLTDQRSGFHKTALAASSSAKSPTTRQRVAIVGGGLAGLSTTYHLLKKTVSSSKSSSSSSNVPFGLDIEIIDIAEVGTGGASSVAGG